MESNYRSRLSELSRRGATPGRPTTCGKLRRRPRCSSPSIPRRCSPNGDISSADARVELLADCDQTGPADQTALWQLRTPIARRRCGGCSPPAESRRPSSRNARPATESQTLLESVLTGKRLPAWEYAPARASAGAARSHRVGGWPRRGERAAAADRPGQGAARLAAAAAAVPRSDRAVVRRPEDRNSDSSATTSASRTRHRLGKRQAHGRENLQHPGKAALFIYGPGGSGKSTLIARFVLESCRPRDPSGFRSPISISIVPAWSPRSRSRS